MKALRMLAIVVVQVISVAASADHYQAGALKIDHPWARPTIGAVGTAAVYFKIENAGETPERLVAARTEIAEGAELHESVEEDGVAKMLPLKEGITVPAQRSVELKPLGMHVMLIGLKTQLKEGQSFPITLSFEKQGDVAIEVKIETPKDGGEAAKPHDHTDH